ncbi:MAG: alpha-amylase family protein [Chloroflexota bacterium]|nr:alpha-amylase family protein [Chloroflexota bacterium]
MFYCLDVETFADSNGDGVGDFPGLTRRLDYLAGLGVTCLWLLPFFPTPNRDDGYDVADYTAIDPRLGDMADFTEFMTEAAERGIKVLMELIPNHTSTDHPWFREACANPESRYRDYYVWRTDDPGDTSDQVVFPGHQDGIWSWNDEAQAWYLHHFYPHQADLNFSNPAVRDEFRKIMGFWLQQGVSGFRIDAAPFLIDPTGLDGQHQLENTHAWLHELREFAMLRSGNAVLLGEVNVALSKLADYFGGGNELQALYNFPMSRFVFLALALESADPVTFGLSQMPTIPENGQWVNFLRKHDELNLSQLPANEREIMFREFGPDPEVQIYDRGIRRRLAPMFKGDIARLRTIFNVMFSLPGAPLIYYGDEIGMGENLDLPERLSVRTPMQWTPYESAGFSTAPMDDLVRPLTEGRYSFRKVNVSSQRADPDSLLNWLAALIRVRKECPQLGTDEPKALDLGDPAVLALHYRGDDSGVLVITNLSGTPRKISLEAPGLDVSRATDMFRDTAYPRLTGSSRTMTISANGYRWLRLGGVY